MPRIYIILNLIKTSCFFKDIWFITVLTVFKELTNNFGIFNCFEETKDIVIIDICESDLFTKKQSWHFRSTEVRWSFEMDRISEARFTIKDLWKPKIDINFAFEIVTPHNILRLYIKMDDSHSVEHLKAVFET